MFTPSGATPILIQALRGAKVDGLEMPRLARGIASGVSLWLQGVQVSTTDAGTAGVGAGFGTLALLSFPLLNVNLSVGFGSSGLQGDFAPTLARGIASGLSRSLASQAILNTTHPTVGSGTAIVRLYAPSIPLGVQAISQGMLGAGLTGDTIPKLASALEIGLRVSVHSLVLPLVIVGPVSPVASTGIGFGSVR